MSKKRKARKAWLSPYEASRQLGLAMVDLQRLMVMGTIKAKETKDEAGNVVRYEIDAQSVSKLVRSGLTGKRLREEVRTQATAAHMQHMVAETQQQAVNIAGRTMLWVIVAAAAVLLLAGVAFWVWG